MSTDPQISLPDSELFFGRVVVPVPNQNKPLKKGKLGDEYAEHAFIGDSIKLTLADGSQAAASDHKFTLLNGLTLTYGQINALAGDFYGTYHPISDGKNDGERMTRFQNAYDTLASPSSRQPKEANEIIAVLQAEAYATLPGVNMKLWWITFGRSDFPGYFGLARINWDHFGEYARTAYNAGHSIAIQKAVGGDLEGAYTLNAFADHFLEDSFSAGHLRTPRKHLHKDGFFGFRADLCAKFMHDEDCAIGFQVSNPAGESWQCYGDKRALDQEAAENLKRCVAAVQASADEIYTAYSTGTAPSPSNYAVWEIAPTLDSARSTNQQLATLFTFGSRRRKGIKTRRVWEFTTDWGYASTVAECELSGYWNYPITLDGPQSIIPWSCVSVATLRESSLRVFYQTPSWGIIQSVYVDGVWTAIDQPLIQAAPFSPLTSITWDNGNEIRVYYLDTEYFIQDYCYSDGRGWYLGKAGHMRAKARPNSRLSAIYYDNPEGISIRVYYQEDGSNVIAELNYDGSWYNGRLRLSGALEGTSLAAVTYTLKTISLYPPHIEYATRTRLYYQTQDLSLREHCHNDNDNEWFAGEFDPGKVPGGSSISALATGGEQIEVYWRDIDGDIVVSKIDGTWGDPTQVMGTIGVGYQFAVLQWEKGKLLRLYYQTENGYVGEYCSDDSGVTWTQTSGLQLGGS